jgi:hypothetical protein
VTIYSSVQVTYATVPDNMPPVSPSRQTLIGEKNERYAENFSIQRHQTLPAAQTSSAREAQKSFYCNLCSKGYSRMNDYEAHLSSYDHSHKQRLKDMKAMVRDPNAGARARKAEAKADGLMPIKMAPASTAAATVGGSGSSGGGGGFKKGGFKKSGFKSAFTPVEGQAAPAAPASDGNSARSTAASTMPARPSLLKSSSDESDTEDEGYEMYDPSFPTE